jgi:hypothetical protein
MKLFVPLNASEFDRLTELAQSDRRRPQDQAAMLLARALQPEASNQALRPAAAAPVRAEGGAT